MGARIAYLSDDDKAAIYEAALEIMGTIGQRVHHPEALELLRAAGAEVVEPDLVKVPRELVEKARRTAPAVIEVYDRAGEPPCRSAATTRTSATARRSPASTTWRPASTGRPSSPTA